MAFKNLNMMLEKNMKETDFDYNKPLQSNYAEIKGYNNSYAYPPSNVSSYTP